MTNLRGPARRRRPAPARILVEADTTLPGVRLPAKATGESACFDLHAAEDCQIVVGRVTLVRTGLKMRPPPGTFLEVRPRSGLSTRGVLMPNAPGTIDRDYGEEIRIPLTLLFGTSHLIRAGDRIAQARLVPELPGRFHPGVVRPLGSRRGGFGSTGR